MCSVPWSNETERADYYQNLFNQQLAICDRLQAENEELDTCKGILISDKFELLQQIKEQDAEIERLEAEVKALVEYGIHERYPHIVLCGNGAIFTKSLEEYDKLIADISAEARKEFAERLHEYINRIIERHEMPMFPFSIAFVSGIETKIDNLLIEMESEQH